MVEPEAAADEGRILAGRERGGDENRGGAVFPEPLTELPADLDGSPRERLGLGPHDAFEPGGLEARLHLGGDTERTA